MPDPVLLDGLKEIIKLDLICQGALGLYSIAFFVFVLSQTPFVKTFRSCNKADQGRRKARLEGAIDYNQMVSPKNRTEQGQANWENYYESQHDKRKKGSHGYLG